MTYDASFWVCAGFILFMAAVGRPGWRMVKNSLDARRAKIKQDIEEAARLRAEAQTFLQECKRQQAQATLHVQEILSHAEEEVERLKQQSLAEMQAYIQAEERLLRERMKMVEAQALEEIRIKAVDAAVHAAEEIIKKTLTAQHEQAILQNILIEMQEQPSFKIN